MVHISSPDASLFDDDCIAVVGLGCRFPGGANDPPAFWELLKSSRDAISETPADRWNLQKFYSAGKTIPGKTQSRWGGYVDGIDQFDAPLFGISPREAAGMDPQQRMLLEVAWQALEDGGQPLERVAGRSASVFVGISSFDYAVAGLSFDDRSVMTPYSNTGGSSSIAANRISYCFDLRGPSVAVDTACSSSLVALHLACESLRSGEAEMALAGGVNALLLPDFYVAFSQLGVLSPDGRCKTFDAAADGYVRSEGAGMVLLKPMRDAVRDGDDVYCVIRASVLNQDGHTDGMTVPSRSAQQALMQRAYHKAGVDPSLVSYVEAHGTGTPVGDPIEAAAIGQVIGRDPKRTTPCYVGSVKTNIGHLEAGAGIASVIKVALAMRHRTIPRHRNVETVNPAIDFESNRLRLPLTARTWRPIDGRRIAGINGFGYGGANAHVVMEALEIDHVTDVTRRTTAARSSSPIPDAALDDPFGQIGMPLPISAQSADALSDVAESYQNWLRTDGRTADLADIIDEACRRRSHLRERRMAFGRSTDDLADRLAAFVDDDAATVRHLDPAQRETGILFVCCGQGPQHFAMGRQLYAAGGSFRSMIDHCDQAFQRDVPWSLVQELHRGESESRMQETSIAQPALFAIQVALAAQWKAFGVTPAAVVGHSVGEIAAAHLSGALSLSDACRVAVHRGRTMDLASSRGSMIAAGISAEKAESLIDRRQDRLSLAAVNGPHSVTISGEATAIEDLAKRLDDEGVFCRRLAVEYAFHSPQMDPVEQELLRCLADIQAGPTTTPMISTVSGDWIDGTRLAAEYWWLNVRQGVLFAPAIDVAVEHGFGLAVELGPHPVLSYAINECSSRHGRSMQTVASMRRDRDDVTTFRDAMQTLYRTGAGIDWTALSTTPDPRVSARGVLRLPTYPMQRQRLWTESRQSKESRLDPHFHPLLGSQADAPEPGWKQTVSTKTHAYLADHQVRASCLYPAAAMIETGLAAHRRLHNSPTQRLRCVRLHQPLVLESDRLHELATTYRVDRQLLDIRFRESDSEAWQNLATMDLSSDNRPPASACPLAEVHARCTEIVSQQQCYDYCERLGLNYGPLFRGVVSGRRRDGEALVQVRLPAKLRHEAAGHVVHPMLLDACFHAMIVADVNFDEQLDDLYLPHGVAEVVWGSPSDQAGHAGLTELTAHVTIVRKDAKRMIADLTFFDSSQRVVGCLKGFESRNAGGKPTVETSHDLLYRYRWEPQTDPPATVSMNGHRRWLVLADQGGLSDRLVARQRLAGIPVTTVHAAAEFSGQDANHYRIDPTLSADWDRLLAETEARSITDIVMAWALDLPGNATGLDQTAVEQSLDLSARAPLEFVQAWHRRFGDHTSSTPRPKLCIVTRQAQSPDLRIDDVSFCQSPLIGIGRVLISEVADFSTRLVDLSEAATDDCLRDLIAELSTDDAEDEVMYRDGVRHVRRFVPNASVSLPGRSNRTAPVDSSPRRSRLCLGKTSGIAELRYAIDPAPELADHEVEIEVSASGLNFSDVMKALDLYPGLPDGPVLLGAECCGRVSRIGEKVTAWEVGDEVVAIAKASFATHAVVDQDLVARKPRSLSADQAATFPIAFLTAHYALDECARLRAGESVLIHSASGGVGLAAIQLAERAGLRIHATAGSETKREYLRELGVDHVSDSRSLAFADDVRRATAGDGVDAVLNSLPGEAIVKGLELLKSGGRFLEIGKRDIYGDRPLNLAPFRNNLAFFAIDLDQLFTTQKQRMGEMLRSLSARFDTGELRPLPVRPFDADQSRDAFRFMQQAKHIGKVAVNYATAPSEVFPQTTNPPPVGGLFRSTKSYWIAGGLGGFGLEIAKWMAEQGAGHLVLSGRSKDTSDEAATTIRQLESRGTRVTVIPTDITDQAAVRQTLRRIRDELPVLGGIFHTAMVLEDRLIDDIDEITLRRVLRPKVVGGWNLHEASSDADLVGEPLDHFVLFSSLSSIFGHAGQASYSAANAALDGLAYHRRARGLPALVVNWGHVGEVGYLAEREELGDRLERQGVLRFSIAQATECLQDLIRSDAIQASVLRMDWSRWRGLGLTKDVSPRFANLIRHDTFTSDRALDTATIRSVDEPQRQTQIASLITGKLTLLLGLRPDQIDADRSLLELGLDSLMAVELRNWIEGQLKITMPISELMRGASIDRVAKVVSELMRAGIDEVVVDEKVVVSTAAVEPVDPENLIAAVDHMDDAEVDQLLQRLGGVDFTAIDLTGGSRQSQEPAP